MRHRPYVSATRRPFRIGIGIARGHVHRLRIDLGWWRVWIGRERRDVYTYLPLSSKESSTF